MAAIAAVLTLTVLVTFSQAEAVQGAAGGASAPEEEAGDKDAWRDAQITLDERGIPYIRYPYDNGVRELEGEPIPAPREWADQDLAGRGEASALEFSPEIWGRLVSPTDGWLVASYDRGAGVTDIYIYKTSDGGMNWTEVTAPGLDYAIADVGFVSPNRLIVAQKLFVGAPVYLTKDGGLSWELINLPWTDAEVDSIYVSGGSVQMVLFGDGSSTWTMTSDDFGDTWTSWDNAALDLLLSEMTAEDIGEETSVDAKEMARALREASPHRWSRLYTGEGNFDQTSAWVWCDVVEALPLKAGGTLYMAASYRNETDLMIGWETEAGIQYAIYASPELHALVSRLGRTYPAETLPHTPDLNHDGEPDQIFLCRARPDSTDLCLRFLMETEDGRETWEETASTAHAGWIGLFLVQRDGEDCLLRYTPYSGGGACAYRYQLFYLQDDGAELVQENSVDFDFNFDREGSHQFDPRAIAGFMTEINSLLARSTPLLITDPNLAATFEREGRLYDSLGWLEEDGFTRGVGTTLLQDLLAYRNWRLEQGAIPSLDAVFSEIRAEDISSTGRAGVSARELAPILNSGARSQAADGRDFPDEASWTMAVTYVREGDLEEQKLLLEGSELPDIVRVTLSGQATAVQYSENPSVDGMYLHDVPYSRTVYIQNESLYQLLAGID